MPFKKGHKKIGGRRVGSETKIELSLTVLARLEELGHDPIQRMVAIADDDFTPIEVKAKMESELAKYIYPQKKHVEHVIEEGQAVNVITDASLEMLRARVAGITLRERARGVLPITQLERTGTD